MKQIYTYLQNVEFIASQLNLVLSIQKKVKQMERRFFLFQSNHRATYPNT